MKKIIIFGAGHYGRNAYKKLKHSFDIVCFADNNPKLAGSDLFGVPIVAGESLKDIKTDEISVFICTRKHHEIGTQLREMGIESYYIMLDGFLYHTSLIESMQPVEFNYYPYHKKCVGEKNILYAQNAACIRTYKTAATMKSEGYRVFLLYTQAPPEDKNRDFAKIFDGVFTFYTMQEIMDFVNNSEFDVIHSSNEPDLLTNLLCFSNKPIVFDTHDMNSLRGNDQIEDLFMEYMANVYSDGNVYVTEEMASIARKMYGLENKNIFALPNYVYDQVEIVESKEKLSSKDHEIHLVYEGGIEGTDKAHHRYFEDIWQKFADSKIHIHYYSQSDYEYCKALEQKSEYFHYEGNMGTNELIQEMTKYDCGIAIFNLTEKNLSHLNIAAPNKVYEYLNAEIPVLIGGLELYNEFVEKYNVGGVFDYSKDVKEQILAVCNKKVPPNFLRNNGFTVMSYSKDLVDFYEKVQSDYYERKSMR